MFQTSLSTRNGDVTVIKCTGRLTMGEGSVMFRDTVRNSVSAGARILVLDMTGLDYIDTSGIGELVSAYTSTRNAGGQLMLAGLTKRVTDLLQITKLYTVFPVFATVDDAVASLAPQQAT